MSETAAVFGGGARSPVHIQAIRRHTGLPVTAGPVEATAMGNALVQGVALGIYADLADARAHVRRAGRGGKQWSVM